MKTTRFKLAYRHLIDVRLVTYKHVEAKDTANGERSSASQSAIKRCLCANSSIHQRIYWPCRSMSILLRNDVYIFSGISRKIRNGFQYEMIGSIELMDVFFFFLYHQSLTISGFRFYK